MTSALVSIPRSGFCSFKRFSWIAASGSEISFNPSVGILFIQARVSYPFRWDRSVSIPRSGFCSFKLANADSGPSNPKPFQSLGRDSVHSSFNSTSSLYSSNSRFNPSVGILFIQAPNNSNRHQTSLEFQSLGRDSVHSSSESPFLAQLAQVVSIPRSGFCSFKLVAALPAVPDL